ncbi:hypothetical protein P8452_38797 [Trifolium repens]|nr:hypothetical protein P8452_38797 [Trifolium repens]
MVYTTSPSWLKCYVTKFTISNLFPTLTGIIPCTLLIPGLFFIPESPGWLAKMGMTEEFENSLQVLRGYETDISVEVNEIKTAVASSNRRTTVRFAELKQRRYWLPLMIGIGLLVLQQLSGINGVLFYSSTIFQNAGISSSDAATFGVGAVQVLATTLTLWLADKSGRRLLIIVSSSGMALSLLVVSIAFYLKDYISPDSFLYGILSLLSMGGVVVMVIAFSLGMGAMPWIIMSEPPSASFIARMAPKRRRFEPTPAADHPSHTNKSRKISQKYWTVDVRDARGVVKVVRLRSQDVFRLPPGQKILMEWSRDDQPVGEAAGLLGGYIGSVGTNFNKFPIDKLRWPDVSSQIKNEVYKDSIQTKFDVNDGIHKDYILGKIGKRLKPENQEKAAKNAANRAKQTIPHTLGTMTWARFRHGRSYKRMNFFFS